MKPTTVLGSSDSAGPKSGRYSGYNHCLKIAGVLHDVQTEFIGGAEPKIVSHAFIAGRVVDSEVLRVSAKEVEDDLWMRRQIKGQQKEMIRRLVVASRTNSDPSQVAPHPVGAERRAEPDSAVSAQRRTVREGDLGGLGKAVAEAARLAEELELREALVRFARLAERSQVDEPVDQLRRLVRQSRAIFGPDLEQGRSLEVAELALLRAESNWCLNNQQSARVPRLLAELVELGRSFTSINDRASLREHDRSVWAHFLTTVSGLDSEEPLDGEHLDRLAKTWGRDAGLDELLEAADTARVGEVRAAVDGALKRLETQERDMQTLDTQTHDRDD